MKAWLKGVDGVASAVSTTSTTSAATPPWAIRDKKRLVWAWMVYAYDAGGVPAEDMYPGDDLVDWVGVDGYPYNSTITPSGLLGPMVNRMQAMTDKPIYIDQVGVPLYDQPQSPATVTGVPEVDKSIQFAKNVVNATVSPPGASVVAAKSQWIEDYWQFVDDEGIKLSQWFNVGEHRVFERDAVNPRALGDCSYVSSTLVSYAGYCTYRAGVQSTWVQGSRGRANGVVTDAELLGQ